MMETMVFGPTVKKIQESDRTEEMKTNLTKNSKWNKVV